MKVENRCKVKICNQILCGWKKDKTSCEISTSWQLCKRGCRHLAYKSMHNI
uniref:Uncharacterized protein n=1 Tax=Rhizophora mucronata TaxID=61149 RepID=A0A2P2PUE6_RHIMU